MTPRSPHHPIRLRPARPADLAAMQRIEQDSYESEAERFDARQVRRLIGNPRAVVCVAVSVSNRVIGWAAGLVRRGGTRISGRVYALAVHPEAQGLSAGRKLLNRTVASLKRRGATRIYLEVRSDNAPAIALYRKIGFAAVASLPSYYAPGRDALRMRLTSPASASSSRSAAR